MRERTSRTIELLGASDPGSTRLVYAMVAGLAILGIGFILLGVWLIRRTRVDPEVLAPLERMGDSDWLKRDTSTQRRLLDDVRPDGAAPLHEPKAVPRIDREFDEQAQQPAASLSDLGPGVIATTGSVPTPAEGIPVDATAPSEQVEQVEQVEQAE
ncbi:MAG: hypothetical protein WBP59_14385 [Ilumatobacteraceae bacterium]